MHPSVQPSVRPWPCIEFTIRTCIEIKVGAEAQATTGSGLVVAVSVVVGNVHWVSIVAVGKVVGRVVVCMVCVVMVAIVTLVLLTMLNRGVWMWIVLWTLMVLLVVVLAALAHHVLVVVVVVVVVGTSTMGSPVVASSAVCLAVLPVVEVVVVVFVATYS
jgi:hypothetical protein